MSFRNIFRPLVYHAAVAMVLLSSVSEGLAQPLRPEAELAIDRMSLAAGAQVSVTRGKTGLVSFLSTRPGAPIPVSKLGSAEERARAFLGTYGSAFGIGPGVGLTASRVSPIDEAGMEHVRFRQTYQGVPITGGELTVHLFEHSVVAVNAKTLADLEGVRTDPTLGAPEAEALARDILSKNLGVADAVLGEPRLELLNKGLLGRRGFSTELTWFIEARRVDLREFLWIDAHVGKPVLQFSQLTDARDRAIYDADDPGDGVYDDLPGALVRVEGGPPVVGPAGPDANDAYEFSGDTYDYFHGEHGRDSYDGAGATLISTVRYCPDAGSCPYANAFWNGDQMVYGEGFPAADDADAHELTHAVTEHSAALFYYMQSGALNESYSDIFGETVDLLNGAGTDTPGVRWQIGEDIPGFGVIRDMMDPTLFGDPGKTSDPEFVCGDPGGDSGGVHTNSGVPNHAYALMVDGGTYNGETVTGIGLIKAGKIQYRALSQYLLSASDFLDNDNAIRQACRDLIGTAGITAGDCTEVGRALDAVEMNLTWPCTPVQATFPAFCPAGQSPELAYYDDFENVTGLATCSSTVLPSSWCLNQPSSLLGAFATSGVQSLWGYDRPVAASTWVQVVFGSMPPASSRLQFNHSYGFENFHTQNFDGGQVQTSTDGGATWQDAGALITAGAAYGGKVSNCCSNPLAGQSAFVRDSWGYTATQLGLSPLSGSAFGYRFLIGTDSGVDDYGWFVDDARIYTCAACLANRTLDGAYTGMASHYKASNSIVAGDGFTVKPGEDVTFEVGNFVALESGFRVEGAFTVITDSGACP